MAMKQNNFYLRWQKAAGAAKTESRSKDLRAVVPGIAVVAVCMAGWGVMVLHTSMLKSRRQNILNWCADNSATYLSSTLDAEEAAEFRSLTDYATGMTKAWNAGELSSRVGLWGILKKVGYLVIVGVACVVDWLLRYGADSLGWNWPVDFLFASIVIIWLVINELLSILENVSAIGAPVPGFMQALLKKLKVHTEDTAEENLPGEENSDE